MRSRRPTPEHQEAVARRLALLTEQLGAPPEEVAPAAGGDWWAEHTRVAPARPLVAVPDRPPTVARPAPAAAAPSVVPVPGRHAARRRPARPELRPELLPATLRGRVRLGPGPVAVVAVLVAVGLALTCWQVVRDDPAAPVEAPAPAGDLVAVPAGGAESAPQAPAPSSAGEATGTVTVDVAGRVRRPGIVVLDAGARVVDALEEAGGARASVDLSTLNLARPLVDGEQIVVGVAGAAPQPGVPPSTASPPGAPVPLVDLNLAGQVELETLPDVGPVTAGAIIAWREEHGGFSAVTELLEVDGIGDATLETLTPLVTV